MGTGRKSLLVDLFVLLIGALIVAPPLAACIIRPEPEPLKQASVPFVVLTPDMIRDPELARKYGIVGYVEVTLAPDAPRSLIIKRGSDASVTLVFHFVSYLSPPPFPFSLLFPTRTDVYIDQGLGCGVTQCYAILDEAGNVTGRGEVNYNELVSYNPTGTVTINANQTLPVTMTIRIPIDYPLPEDFLPLRLSDLSSFRLRAMGIGGEPGIIILDCVDIEVRVHA